MIKLIRITTIPLSFILLKGQMAFMLKKGFLVKMVSARGKEINKIIETEGCMHHSIPFTRKITPFKDLKALILLYFFLIKEKPQIVHTHTPKAGIIGMVASKLAGIPIRLHTVAGLPVMESKGIKRKLLCSVEKITYSCATKIYPNSFGLKNFILKQKFCSPDKLKVLGYGSSNGINIDFFRPNSISQCIKKNIKNNLHIQSSDFIFIFVGRLVPDKGINELVAAFLNINLVYSNIKLLLVGPYEKNLYPLCFQTEKEIEENSSIINIGFQNDVRPWFSISDCLVFPSYREGFPNAVMQAGAMGLPSIVTDINGCNEIIIDEYNGLIIPPKDIRSLENSMIRIYLDKELKTNLAKKARQSIISRFEQSIFWNLLLDEYSYQLQSERI